MALYPAVEIKGLSELQASLGEMPAQVGRARRDAVQVAGQQITKFWKLQLSGPAGPRRLGVGHGTLRRSIRSERRGDGVAVGTHMPYAAIHEFGGRTKPHDIKPRVAKALRFRQGGKEVFRRKVRHPGSHIPARPHRRPAVQSVWPVLQRVFAGKLEDAMKASLAIGNRISAGQKSALEQIVAGGGTGRRTR